MTIEERLKQTCSRVEFVYGWPEGTLSGDAATNNVTRLRDQVIYHAYENNIEVKSMASFFSRSLQSIYMSITKAEKDKEFQKKYAEVLGWLCDV